MAASLGHVLVSFCRKAKILYREKVVHIIMEKRIMYLVSGFPKKLTPLKYDYTPMKG